LVKFLKKFLKLLTVFALIISQNTYANSSLWFTEQMVSFRFGVNHISHQKLQTMLSAANNQTILIFDVRRPEEYQTSRIKGSILIAPDMTEQEFMAQYGDKIPGKSLVFYCSVGYRSSQFIQRIEEQAKAKNVTMISNLKGGIFRWYNEKHPVINNKGETDDIHPSDESWAKMIDKR